MTENEEFLGDGLYASFDGWHIALRAPRHGPCSCGQMHDVDHLVYLELGFGGTLGKFLGYVDRCLNLAEARQTAAEKAQSRINEAEEGFPDD